MGAIGKSFLIVFQYTTISCFGQVPAWGVAKDFGRQIEDHKMIFGTPGPHSGSTGAFHTVAFGHLDFPLRSGGTDLEIKN